MKKINGLHYILQHQKTTLTKKGVVQILVKITEVIRHVFFTKPSHKKRIREARRLLRLFNSSDFRDSPARMFAYLRKIDAFTFEELLLLCFSSRGFKVKHNTAYTGDGGIDGVVILPDKTRWAIQAKRYAHYINARQVNDFYSVVRKKKFDGGIFMHTGKTGKQAYSYLNNNILLISGRDLHEFITKTLH